MEQCILESRALLDDILLKVQQLKDLNREVAKVAPEQAVDLIFLTCQHRHTFEEQGVVGDHMNCITYHCVLGQIDGPLSLLYHWGSQDRRSFETLIRAAGLLIEKMEK